MIYHRNHIDGLVQDRRNSIANALELRLSCSNPSIYIHVNNIKYSFFITTSNMEQQTVVHKVYLVYSQISMITDPRFMWQDVRFDGFQMGWRRTGLVLSTYVLGARVKGNITFMPLEDYSDAITYHTRCNNDTWLFCSVICVRED